MNHFKKFFNKKVINISVFVIILAFIAIYSTSVKSSSIDNISGYGWSADDWTDVDGNGTQAPTGETMSPPGGMGWLSFNCTNDVSCANNTYGVTLNTTNGNTLTGYAWSPYFGWLKFGGLSGFPIGGGTVPENAVLLPNGHLSGWARFCAGSANPNTTCNGGTGEGTSTGGWDGWVALSGTNFGVTLTINPDNTGTFNGYAWGGGQDSAGHKAVGTGWIDWNSGLSGVVYIPTTAPYVLLHANPNIVPQNGTTVLTWEGSGLVAGNNACQSTAVEPLAGDSGWVSTPPAYNRPATGTFTTEQLNQLGTHTFTITCHVEGPGGGTVTSSVDVTVGIGLNLVAEPSPAPYPDYKTTLYWSVVPSDTAFSSCTTSSVPATNWNAYNVNPPVFPSNTNPLNTIDVPVSPTNYTLTCVTSGGASVTRTISVNRGDIPQAGILLTNTDVVLGSNGTYTTKLKWSTTNIVSNSCKAWAEVSGTTWDVPMNKSDFGEQPDVIVPSVPPPPDKTTYRLTCDRLTGGTISAELELNILSKASKNVKPHYQEN